MSMQSGMLTRMERSSSSFSYRVVRLWIISTTSMTRSASCKSCSRKMSTKPVRVTRSTETHRQIDRKNKKMKKNEASGRLNLAETEFMWMNETWEQEIKVKIKLILRSQSWTHVSEPSGLAVVSWLFCMLRTWCCSDRLVKEKKKKTKLSITKCVSNI